VRLVDAAAARSSGRLADAQRAALAEPDGSVAALLLEGVVLRLQADLRWLEACARTGTRRRTIERERTLARARAGARTAGWRSSTGRGGARARRSTASTLDVAPGETVAVMGPSGCGKSTLLAPARRLERPRREVWLRGAARRG
jgi:ABC-type glutathione transport system ATPase component